MNAMIETSPYALANRGSFKGIRHWHELDDFWQHLKTWNDGNWFIYDTNQAPPTDPVSASDLSSFIETTNRVLHEQHQEDYCGIVYADNKTTPTFIKIYDPNNLGVSCGFSDNPPLPGWILSRVQPVELESALNPPNNRRRWWQKIFD